MQTTIDVSKYDATTSTGYKPMDWSTYPLAIMKASEGLYPDPAFSVQWEAAKGKPRMAYHFFRSNQSPHAQASFFWSLLDGFTNRDFVCVDFETQDGMSGFNCLNNVKAFLVEIEKHTQNIPLIYTYPYFWKGIGGESAVWAVKYPLWLAQWTWDNYFASVKLPPYTWTAGQMADKLSLIDRKIIKPMALRPWASPAIWQWTARADPKQMPGYVGVKKAVDHNYIYDMDLEDTQAEGPWCPHCGELLTGWIPA